MTTRKLPNIYHLIKMLVFTSFIGFLVENGFKLFMNGYIDNRFMFLPFLLGYGIFTVAIGVLIGTPQNLIPLSNKQIRIKAPLNLLIYFLLMSLLVTAGELALGFTVEWIAGFHYWDYTALPFHFTRYTSLFTSLGFGFIITIFMGFIYEPVMRFFNRKMNGKHSNVFSIAILALLVADFIASFTVMIAAGKRMKIWRIVFFKK